MADLDLARRAVAAPGWRWKRGMIAMGRRGAPDAWMRVEDPEAGRQLHGEWAGAIPDLDDPATVGCLLALVREVWSAPRAYLMPTILGDWRVCGLPEQVSDDAARCYGPTEAAALVAALEVAHG